MKKKKRNNKENAKHNQKFILKTKQPTYMRIKRRIVIPTLIAYYFEKFRFKQMRIFSFYKRHAVQFLKNSIQFSFFFFASLTVCLCVCLRVDAWYVLSAHNKND